MIKKNALIEGFRFLFSIIICLHHFRIFSDVMPYGGGYLCVDFFCIISGYFLARYCDKLNRKPYIKDISQYFAGRWIRLFPYYIFAWLTALITQIFILEKKLTLGSSYYIREALMIEFYCMPSGERLNPPDWYCGYLLMAILIILIIRALFKEKIFYIFVFFLGIAGYLYLAIVLGILNIFPINECIISIALIRITAGICMGCAANKLSQIIKEKWPGNIGIKYVGLFIAMIYILYMTLYDSGYSFTDYIVVFLFWVAFTVVISNEGICLNDKMTHLFTYLGSLSYAIYLLHYTVVRLFVKYRWFESYDWKCVSVIFIVVVAISAIIFINILKFLEIIYHKFIVKTCQSIHRRLKNKL